MPYKDINQQRERARLAMRVLRAQRKGLTAEEITRLTTNGLTKQKRVNSVNKKGLTTKTKATTSPAKISRGVVRDLHRPHRDFLPCLGQKNRPQ